MKKLALPRGFRDFPPQEMIMRIEAINSIREVFELYGFSPMETPCVEYWETLAGKYGEEAEKRLIWRFEDPFGKKKYALRYDLTVPLARYVSMHSEIPLPLKRYQIGPVWRHEEPQRGRYREFIQADIDTIGSPFMEADAEIINAITKAIEKLGLHDYIIKVNHRALLREIFEKHLALNNPASVYRAIDKLDKIGLEGVVNELKNMGLSDKTVSEIISVINNSIQLKKATELKETLPNTKDINSILEELELLGDLLEKPRKAILDISMVRGLDYYTGVIFEIILEKGSPGSIAGGGRYDDLIGYFRREGSLPATGGSIGFERIMDVIKERRLMTSRKTITKLYIVNIGEEVYKKAWEIANMFRNKGIPVEIDLMRRSQSKQRKRVQALNIKYILFVGHKELETGIYTLVNKETNERITGSIEKIIEHIDSN